MFTAETPPSLHPEEPEPTLPVYWPHLLLYIQFFHFTIWGLIADSGNMQRAAAIVIKNFFRYMSQWIFSSPVYAPPRSATVWTEPWYAQDCAPDTGFYNKYHRWYNLQEAYALHVWEQGSRIRQILNLYRQQEGFARFQITLGKCLEYFHIEVHIIQILVVFQPRVAPERRKSP